MRSRLLGVAWLVWRLALVPFDAAAAVAATEPLVGQVVEVENGRPLDGVIVRIEGTDLEVHTDTEGRFSFPAVPPGPLTVTAQGDGGESSDVSLDTATNSGPVTIHLPKARRPDYERTVTVATTAVPPTASLTEITADEFAAVPRRTAEDALQLVPGLTLVQHGSEGKGHQFFVRGFDAVHGSDLELTVEGVPVNEWSNIHAQGYIDLGFVIPEAISAVHVTKGPFAVSQGAFAMAGSADYRLGLSERNRGVRTAYTAGTTNRHRGVVSFGPKRGDGHEFVVVEALHDDGYGQNRGIDRGALMGRVRLFNSPRTGSLSLLASGYLARFSVPGTLRHQDVQAENMGFFDAYDRAGAGLSSRGRMALTHAWQRGPHRLDTTAYGGYRQLDLLENYTGFLYDPVQGDRRQQEQRTWSFGAKLGYRFNLARAWVLHARAGFRGDHLDQIQHHVDQEQIPVAIDRELGGLQTLSHVAVALGWWPLDAIRLTVGSRADLARMSVDDARSGQTRAGTLWAVSPRVTAETRGGESLRVFAAYGRGFRPPEARAYSSFSPDVTGITDDVAEASDPAMTVTDSAELGTRWRVGRVAELTVAGFATFLERETVLDHVSGTNLDLNRSRRLGGEAVLAVTPLDWLTFQTDATYADARFVDSGQAVPLAPWLTGSLRATAMHRSGLRGGVRWMALAPRPLPHGARGSWMTVLDASVGYRWRWLGVGLEVENVLNQRVREGEYHYASHWRPNEAPSAIPVLHFVAGPPLNARLTVSATF
ncbi:MAG: TonB-dependent receptor [Myxococcales bacterium FL481]|nr:MAG: TonB-dependent receptor [Myxococcales bacterium FL481]